MTVIRRHASFRTWPGWEELHHAADDERSERTRSVPSVASRRVAAPYGDAEWRSGEAIPLQINWLATLAGGLATLGGYKSSMPTR